MPGVQILGVARIVGEAGHRAPSRREECRGIVLPDLDVQDRRQNTCRA
jgi:hypothetical protein